MHAEAEGRLIMKYLTPIAPLVAALLAAPALAAGGASGIKLKDVQEEKAPKGRSGPADFKAPLSLEITDRETATAKKRDEMIEELKKIIPDMPESEQKADLYFQLAEAYWEKARFESIQEVHEYDEAYAKWNQARQKDRESAGDEPRVSTRRSDAYRKEALGLYNTILERYKDYPRRDEVLFAIAYNQYEIGNKAAALAAYSTLIKQHPTSKLVPDAYVQMGEHYFASNDLRRARAAFQKAVDFRLPKLIGFSLYKLAWCDYNVQDYEAAIDKFKQVIAYSEQQAASQSSSRDRVQLRNEALKDLVLAYAQIDAIDSAIAYLREKTGTRSLEFINRLASTYFESGKYEASIRVYRMLISQEPMSVRAPAWNQKILLAYDKLNKRDRVVSEMKVLVKSYGPQSDWAKANAENKGAVGEAADLAQSALSQLVQDYHHEALKTKNVSTYRLARDIYRDYLETFPKADDAYNLRFLYAETLYALDQWEEAGVQYARVVDENPKGQYTRLASYDAILALEKEVAVSKGKLRRRDLAEGTKIDERARKGRVEETKRKIRRENITKDTGEDPIPELEQKLIAACEKYLQVAPDSKDEQVIRYKVAFTYYDHHHYVEAAKRFGEVILKWPTGSEAQKAADLSLDILNSKEEWLALSDLAYKFRENSKLSKPGSEFYNRVSKLGEGARFKYVMDLFEKKKQLPLAAEEFRKFVQRYPTSEYAPLALYNALVIADQADQLDLAIESAYKLMSDYPKQDDKLAPKVVLSLASAYERSGQIARAVEWFEKYVSRWPDAPNAPDQLFNACLWREGLGEERAAISCWERYLDQYKTRADAPRIAFSLGLLLEKRHRWSDVVEHWHTFRRTYASRATAGQLLLARYKEAMAMRKVNKSDPNVNWILNEVAKGYSGLPESERQGPVQDAVAHARFMGMQKQFEEFLKIHFRYVRQADLVFVLRIKNKRLKSLLDGYTAVIQTGSPLWTEASLTRLGEAYRNFNKGLMAAPMPRGLDADQQDLYRSTLERQALPLEDKAVEAYEKAVETSSRTGLYSEWTTRAQEALLGFKPDAFGEVHKPALVAADPMQGAIAPEPLPKQAGGSGGY
jgi:TolA-binding protein